MKQVNIYPEYYKKFRCTADKCTDSCCAGWQIVVDDEKADIYERIDGGIGEKLRQAMETDEDGDIVFRLENDRCPFWETSGLCELHRTLGEEYLCHTCREYPRAVQDYADFAEHDLSLSCPEAARIILSMKNKPSYEAVVREIPDEEICYDSTFMELLKAARREMLGVIWDKSYSPAQVLRECFEYAQELQKQIDEESYVFVPFKPSGISGEKSFSYDAFTDRYLQMDILTEEWRSMLLSAKALGEKSVYSPEYDGLREKLSEFDTAYRQIFEAYINRYWLRTAFDYDAVGKIKLMAAAYAMITRVQTAYYDKNKELPFSASLRIVQLYSKETEHNTDYVCL